MAERTAMNSGGGDEVSGHRALPVVGSQCRQHVVPCTRLRWRLLVHGVVQGVGFRPFVYRLAKEAGVNGFVFNDTAGVVIEAEGAPSALAAFQAALRDRHPPAAEIRGIVRRELPPVGADDFVILPSPPAGVVIVSGHRAPHLAAIGPTHVLAYASPSRLPQPAAPCDRLPRDSCDHLLVTTSIPPDLAVCEACLAEIFDPVDRRHLYPFINCTDCGPRYTISEGVPYDRGRTSMRHFAMCPACRAEYDDPGGRRFHAQPNACPECGPSLAFHDQNGRLLAVKNEALAATGRILRDGGIVAIKGIGGFHLAVNGSDEAAVARLRQRKKRPHKPLALMVRDLTAASRLAELAAEEKEALASPARPILLVRPGREVAGLVAPSVAPGQRRLGLMLAYAPLHHLLLADDDLPVLVMTSANRSQEPLCIANQEAFRRLAGIADAFLVHDRDIYLGNDDSVAVFLAGKVRLLRRGRGYVPRPLPLASSGPVVLGVGAELKNTVCLATGSEAVVSQHLGDLQNLESYRVFGQTIDHLQTLLDVTPALVCHDLHPDYLSRRWAEKMAEKMGSDTIFSDPIFRLKEEEKMEEKMVSDPIFLRLAVQHHHAHLAACLAENRHPGPAVGLILDGTGYGSDGAIWGGEILIGDATGYARFGHLETMPLPGGDLAVQQPWRAGFAYLYEAFDGRPPELPFMAGRDRAGLVAILERQINCRRTSSCGRFFDAVAAICGLCPEIDYEAQAAIEWMNLAGGVVGPAFSYALAEEDGRMVLQIKPLLREVARAVLAGESPAVISRRFHYTLIAMFSEAAQRAAQAGGLRVVALSGGAMQNEILFSGLRQSLIKAGLIVLDHALLPPNDGCISLGQAAIGRAWLARQAQR